MARQFDIPQFYRSPIIGTIKSARTAADPRKRDLTPSVVDFGPVNFKIARNFGFCYGVENAVEIAYRTLEAHPDRRHFMLSEMIHNSHVNDDLRRRGMLFLRSTMGEELIPLSTLKPDDVVVIPAFGTTLELKAQLEELGVDVHVYDTTCPFVTKVWRRSEQIGRKNYTVIVHGKRYHEESQATFSHAQQHAPVVVVRDTDEAHDLAALIKGKRDRSFFFERFADRYSKGFDPDRDLKRIGVVNQTTMLVTETQAVTDILRAAINERYGSGDHFIDTSDTLCYATHENQEAARALVHSPLDLALVIGGYNSSNTSQIVTLCKEAVTAYFISGAEEILSPLQIRHFDYEAQKLVYTENWLPEVHPVSIALTAGASCPDMLLDEVICRIVSFFPGARSVEEALGPYAEAIAA